MNNVLISLNPKAGRRSPFQRADELSSRLNEKGFRTEILTNLDEVTEKANSLFANGDLRALIGVGGDGTAATLVNRTTPGMPIALLSAGTANLLAKFFRLGRTPKRLADMIERGNLRTLDAGKIVAEKTERLFLVMASCGFDADVVRQVHSAREERFQKGHRKGAHISYFSYIKPIFRSLAGYSFHKMIVEQYDESTQNWTEIDSKARWAFFFNLNAYGWGLPLAPHAKGDDGKLDHVLFRGNSVVHGALYTAFAQCGSAHRFLPNTKMGQSTKYRLSPKNLDDIIPFQIDGDPGGKLPIEIEIIPNRFNFFVP
ncbi:MAG: diacylglycerol/lipid kinase family protein [Thermoguttaceae bacterium]